ncbi:hypothetical protein [Streptantibioticus silvisoli]|jgi:hypothetical protein|uniref:Amidohydrolase-related domain-containing protein n=1 Tax=Streptantibioticus silvisoli TaxID=2705255 RepID=A0ABT6WA03_9ACTN|nr:hypothetical protein [Streptantibioticus silvisoli]MDI5966573.1 hypothetical protein [Streptantibioticus silvisoli]
MLTIHTGTSGAAAVVVSGALVEATGTPAELTRRFPTARVRQWPGELGAGRVHDGPLPDAPSPRERVHALLRLGVTAVTPGTLADPLLRSAAARVGLTTAPAGTRTAVPAAGGRADLAVFDADGVCLATVLAGRLVYRRA